ncbi:MAG: radical SAM protein [Desulfotomaculaceae bacterium]|nr:radical SAM protein [Desulfotomaculaceae bacterium]
MRYEGAIFRPPSEASSLILQISVGCSNNTCTFCSAYKDKKFRVKSWQEIESDIQSASKYKNNVNRIFLADGNALMLDTKLLIKTLERLYNDFPLLERVGIYAGAQDIIKKQSKELKELKEAGLGIVYFGLESGSDKILKLVRKGVSSAKMVEACLKIKAAGLTLSITVISGLGGVDLTEEHASETAAVISAINPDYLSTLTLMVVEGTPLYDQVQRGEFKLMTPIQDLQELKLMLEKVTLSDCTFRSNHASNYLPLKGVLNRDREALLSLLTRALSDPDMLRPEYLRGL